MPTTFDSIRLDVQASAPLWRQLYLQLDELIMSGKLRSGDSLPPERDMAEKLGVSRSTVKRSYDELRHAQRLGGRGRAGSVVRAPRRHGQASGPLRGVAEELQERGHQPSSRVLRVETVCDERVAAIFHRPSTARLLYVERVRSGDGQPMVLERVWYDLTMAPQMVGWDGSGPAYERLRQAMKLDLGSAEQSLQAMLSSMDDAQALGLDGTQPQPFMMLKRLTHAANGVPVEYMEASFRGDTYVYRMNLMP
ncbi:GntR family transcriptional regulator [Ottowia sp.]|uniref:GntR family transcriptional regulator n=1 Tax=Ottowia sp. TaxID=1898956 RepID=UPI003A8B50E4